MMSVQSAAGFTFFLIQASAAALFLLGAEMKFEELMFTHLGEIGKYQKIQFLLVCLPTIIVSMHALSWTFSGIHVYHRCQFEGETSTSPYWSNDSRLVESDKCWSSVLNDEVAASQRNDTGVSCYYDKCTYRSASGEMEECEGEHVFDHTHVQLSAMQRWEIVCDRNWIKATIQSMYYVGQMAGSMIFGVLGDRIGRKKVFFLAIVIQIVCGFLMSVAPTWWLYAIFRAGTGFSHPGIFVIAVVIGMELVGPSKRRLASVITGAFFALGQVLLGVEAYFITDYRWLQIAIAAPALLFLQYWWLVPESARWLVSQERYQEADAILKKAAKTNGTTFPDNWWDDLDAPEDEDSKGEAGGEKRQYSFTDLFKTPEMRKRTLAVFFMWPVCSMVYYGMSMKANILGGDMHINFIFSAIVEIPALILVYLLINRIGRRALCAGGYLLAGGCLFANLVMPDNVPFAVVVAQMMVAKASITATYAGIYTFSPELFPTVVRNTAMGCSSTIARVGAIAASYISMWIVETFGKVFMIVPFGSLAVTAGLVCLFCLPETMGTSLPETIQQIEREGKEAEARADDRELEPLSKTENN